MEQIDNKNNQAISPPNTPTKLINFIYPYQKNNRKKKITDLLFGLLVPLLATLVILPFFALRPLAWLIIIVVILYALVGRRWFIILGYILLFMLAAIIKSIFYS